VDEVTVELFSAEEVVVALIIGVVEGAEE